MPTHGARAASSRPLPSARRRKTSRDMWSAWTAVGVCLLAGMLPLARAIQVTVVCADLVGAGGVGIRVWPTLKASPERHSKTLHFRLLQVNWEAERLLEGDWVGVFKDDPRPPHLRPLPTPLPPTSNRDWRAPQPLFWDTPFATFGTITSNYTQPRVSLSVLARGGCVGPYVGFVRNGVCVAAECLASHPTWLYDHRAVLGSRSLRSLVLPGTHNAGSYSLADDNDVVASWVVCQDEDIISQLLYGNRYLDLRVGYYPDSQELLWVNHDLVRWRPLQEVLDAVRGFLALSPDPVIIDIHRTPVGFKMPQSLELLLSLMNATLGGHFVHNRHGPHVTLDDLWQMGKRVVFTFIDPTVSDHTPWVWPPLPQAWANAQMLDDLRTFLDAEMNKRFESPRLWAAMAHLTPTLWDLLFRSHVGVRGLADRVSFSITRWLRQRWGHMANIVASDFFRGNDIINVAIRTNLALSMCRPSDPSRHPYTLRWTTELALRPGSPSTTIPPFVRRMYSGGALWSTTGVRHIHYPFIPVDANISMVFTAISNRVPSMAPGVTYEDSGDTWREVFHYPTDGSPHPPEASASRPDSYPLVSATPSSAAAESMPKASVEAIMAEWDDVDGHRFLDEAISTGVSDVTLDSVNDPPGSGQHKTHQHPAAHERPSLPGTWPSEGNVTEASVLQGDAINHVTRPSPLPRDLDNTESDYDAINNTNSMVSTSSATLYQDRPVALGQGPLLPIDGSSLQNESLLVNGNIQHNNDSLSLVTNDTLDDHSLSVTSNDTQNSSLSTTVISSQNGNSLSSPDNASLENSFLQPSSNNTQDSRSMLANDDIGRTGHSPPEQDDVSGVSPLLRNQLEQRQNGVERSAGGGVTRDVWHIDGGAMGTEPNSNLNAGEFMILPLHQISQHSTGKPQVSKPAQAGTSAVAIHSSLPRVKAQLGSPPVSTVRAQAGASTVTVQPSSFTLREKSGNPTITVEASTPTAGVQPGGATLTTQLGMSDFTATKSSSQVT